ncbi:MAG: hypothetical protein ACRDIC_18045, partial [bacterium]
MPLDGINARRKAQRLKMGRDPLAARATSPARSGAVLTLGIRRNSRRSSRKRARCSRAYAIAAS